MTARHTGCRFARHRKSTSGMTDRHLLWRVVRFESNRVESSTFATLYSVLYSDDRLPVVSRFKNVEGSCCHVLVPCYSFSLIAHVHVRAPRLPVCERPIRFLAYHGNFKYCLRLSTSGILTHDSTSGVTIHQRPRTNRNGLGVLDIYAHVRAPLDFRYVNARFDIRCDDSWTTVDESQQFGWIGHIWNRKMTTL